MANGKSQPLGFARGMITTGVAIVSLMSLYLAADAHAMGKKPEQPKEAPAAVAPVPASQEVEVITPEKLSKPEADIAAMSPAETESTPKNISEPKAAASLGAPDSAVHIKDIQTALKNAGFDPGPADGNMGKKTKKAIRDFQEAHGLKADGKVGPKTWAAMSKFAASAQTTETTTKQ